MSVTGAVLMGLLAARNAGMPVPDDTINSAMEYARRSTGSDGSVAYTGGFGGMGGSMNLTAIATLVGAVSKTKDSDQYKAALHRLQDNIDYHEAGNYAEYFRYYMAQALFQGDYDAWKKWNGEKIRELQELQHDDGLLRRLVRNRHVPPRPRPQLPLPPHLRAMKRPTLFFLPSFPSCTWERTSPRSFASPPSAAHRAAVAVDRRATGSLAFAPPPATTITTSPRTRKFRATRPAALAPAPHFFLLPSYFCLPARRQRFSRQPLAHQRTTIKGRAARSPGRQKTASFVLFPS